MSRMKAALWPQGDDEVPYWVLCPLPRRRLMEGWEFSAKHLATEFAYRKAFKVVEFPSWGEALKEVWK